MTSRDLTAPSQVKELIKHYEFRFKKRFGQNFLIDKNILRKIVDSAELSGDEYVVEVGPGLGTLTHSLAAECKQVMSVEIDRNLVAILNETLDLPNVQVVAGDALKMDWLSSLQQQGWDREPVKMVANLPYYLTTPLIMKALEGNVPFERIVVMVQKEVAQRMQASPGGKEYGVLSLVIQYYAKTTIVTPVPRSVFMPAPDVDSAVICLETIEPPVTAPLKSLFLVIRTCFSQRRKTLRNNLKSLAKQWGIESERLATLFDDLDLDPGLRGEVLSLQQFSDLTEKLLEFRTT